MKSKTFSERLINKNWYKKGKLIGFPFLFISVFDII
jgi:hypothetical protein